MTNCDIACNLWRDIGGQHWNRLPDYFLPDAVIVWPNTSEYFTVADYVRANAEYPGDWSIAIRHAYDADGVAVTVIQTSQGERSFHACSFFQMEEGKIVRLVEYWSEDGSPPQWRLEKGIGSKL